VAALLGVELPVFCERHAKIAFPDTLGALPRGAPMSIWIDPVRLPWSEDERQDLRGAHARLLEELPPGVHGRPEGGADSPVVLLVWTYHVGPVPPTFPLTFDPEYPEVAVRGISRMVPAFARYFDRLPRTVVDGGYYTKTRENRFLAGPLPVAGAFVAGALSGYGLMSSNVAGELVATHVTGAALPAYAPAFALSRYDDPAYVALVERWGDSGQL
jgi:glycine/D-amino acid oxidase-like deaminating enzyme